MSSSFSLVLSGSLVHQGAICWFRLYPSKVQQPPLCFVWLSPPCSWKGAASLGVWQADVRTGPCRCFSPLPLLGDPTDSLLYRCSGNIPCLETKIPLKLEKVEYQLYSWLQYCWKTRTKKENNNNKNNRKTSNQSFWSVLKEHLIIPTISAVFLSSRHLYKYTAVTKG